MTQTWRLMVGDVIEQLKLLPSNSVQCVVTSPPYWGLRDYGTGRWEGGTDPSCDHTRNNPREDHTHGTFLRTRGRQRATAAHASPYLDECGRCGARRVDRQIGMEPTPRDYVRRLVVVFRQVRRVLRPDGTLWLNLGDSYANDTKWGGSTGGLHPARLHGATGIGRRKRRSGLKPKDLVGIPWRVAFALQAAGWWLRCDVIWSKPNPMTESVDDRPSRSHDYIFLLAKSERYFYDAEAITEQTAAPTGGRQRAALRGDRRYVGGDFKDYHDGRTGRHCEYQPSRRNRRSVWTITTQPYPDAHFATFPEELPATCIKAGTSERGACVTCGAPFERVIEKGEPLDEQRRSCGANADGLYLGHATKDYAGSGAQDASAVKGRILAGMVERKTLGWRPTCACYDEQYCAELPRTASTRKRQQQDAADRWFSRARLRPSPKSWPTKPCVVLEPFAGSGTTPAVALQLGRSAIAIELNPKYATDLARPRIVAAAPALFATEATA